MLEGSPPYLREMILFALNIGLRTNEIFNLKWEDVDIEQRRLKMVVKKNQRPLSIPLNEAAYGVIESRHGIQHGPYVFYSPMTGDRFKDVFWFSVKMSRQPCRRGEIPPFGRGFSRQRDLPIRCLFFTGGVTDTPPLSSHRFGESIGLSLGMVASPQSPPPFPPTVILSATRP